MDCTQAQERMWFVDQGNGEDPELEQHLVHCADCNHLWHEIQQFHQELLALKAERPSTDFVDQVMHEVHQAPGHHPHACPQNKWTTWNHLWVASAATFLLLLTGGGLADGSTGIPAIAERVLSLSWEVTQLVGHISNLF